MPKDSRLQRVIWAAFPVLMQMASILAHPLDTENVIIKINTGRVKGFRENVLGRDISIFLGVPYAVPPVGNLRFRRPIPAKTWDGVYDATENPSACIQIKMDRTDGPWTANTTNFSEDCLYLNIWTPSTFNGTLKPVMVWIHGGGFLTGSVDVEFYDGRILSAYGDVVIVSMNYRLGMFGFLNADIEEAPGNMGLYDQALALKWVNENVKFFGGDPQHITLFGHSAGAMSTGFHMISPMTRNLFKRAILQSGSPNLPTFLEPLSKTVERSDKIASLAGCSNDQQDLFSQPRRVIQCLRRLSLEKLIEIQARVQENFDVLFFPRWEDEFLPENPHIALRYGNIGSQKDILIGTVKDEGSFFLYSFFPEKFPKDGDVHNLTIDEARAISRQFFSYLDMSNSKFISNFFLDKVDPYDIRGMVKTMYDTIGDFMFLCPSVFLSEKLQQFGRDVYYYHFTYRAPVFPWPDWMGVAHFDEVPYVFGTPFLYPQQYTSQDAVFSKSMMDLWLTFAKTGRAQTQLNQKWPRYSIDNHSYMELHPETAKIDVGPHERNCNFWRLIFELGV